MPERQSLIERYAAHLPVTSRTPRLTLGEGDTPLVRAPSLEAETGLNRVWLKVEGANPTGSFKDRGMVVAVAKAVEEGADSVLCASTGNTAASAAAYAGRARLHCAVILPAGHVARGKLAQAIVYGAQVIAIEGSFDDALNLAREVAARRGAALVNSVNPHRLEGQKTAAFEICETLGDAPDALFIPVGNAGNITAYWRGFREAASSGMAQKLPRMFGLQAEGAAPIVRGAVVENPETLATAIRIGNPASWKLALAARDESGGAIEAVSDEEIMDAHSLVARCEGIFCEPASAASVAGLRARSRAGQLEGITSAVCVLTGNGMKDVEAVLRTAAEPKSVPASLDAVMAALAARSR